MTERDRERRDGVGVIDEAVELLPLGARLLDGVADHDKTRRQNFHVLARAAEFFHAAFDVGVEFAAGGKIALRGEHRLRGFGRKLAAGFRGAGLHDHRPALHRAGDIHRSAHRKIFALVIEHMHFRRIEKHAVLDVADPGIVRPTVPQPRHHVIEFARPAIALAVLHVVVHAEIQRRIGIGGGDDIPAGAACRKMIERGETARDVIGRVEGRRAGGDEADALGDLRQRRQQRERLERGRGVAALERVDRHVQHRHVVGHEEGVELCPLQRLDALLEMRQIEIHVRPCARIAPGAGVNARRPHESAEVELTGRSHR